MKTINKIIIFIFTFMIINQVTLGEIKQVQMKNTQLRKFQSRIVSQEYEIQVYLPPAYKNSSDSYPVLYLLDADKSFGMAKDIADWLIMFKELPPIIIVGIAYGKDTKDWWNKRSRDYLPTKAKKKIWGSMWPLSGGGDKFKDFLKKELFTFIDKNYRTLPNDRTIAGLSFGGLFASYILFTEPDIFKRYIISGPALLWDDRVVFKKEEHYAKSHQDLKTRVFVSVGEMDDQAKVINPCEEFVKIVKKRAYRGLELKYSKILGDTHVSVWPASISKGLKYIYSKKK